MSELDFELIEDSADQDDSTVETNEETTPSVKTKEVVEENTTSTKKSNWKKISKINKGLKSENSKLLEKIKELEASKVEDTDDDFDDVEDFDDEDTDDDFDKNEFRWFINDNPEAKDFQEQIRSMLDKYPSMSFEDAFDLVKAKTPRESTSSNDFSTKSSNVKVRKKLADLTDEEALQLPNSKYLEYQRLKGKIKR